MKVKDIQDKIKFMDKKTKKYIMVVGIIVILIIIIGIASCAMKDKMLDYMTVEDKMVAATKSYYKDNEDLMPTSGVEEVIMMDTLVNAKYIKPFTRMLTDGANCSGEVKVKNIDGIITYTPYLNCGSAYYSLELYKKIATEANVVVEGDGLYKVEDSYIYRGQNVDNFVSFADKIWRVVKITPENETVLIEFKIDNRNSYVWDDRYNADRKSNSGINDFAVSRLKDSMLNLYETYFSDENKVKLALFDLCVANRGESQVIADGKIECSTMDRDTYIGLLDIYDYMGASLDKTCTAPKDMSCQNYNYLGEANRTWWLMTGNADYSYEAYMIKTSGAIEAVQCNNRAGIRPVIKLKSDIFLRGGSGTEENPYLVK